MLDRNRPVYFENERSVYHREAHLSEPRNHDADGRRRLKVLYYYLKEPMFYHNTRYVHLVLQVSYIDMITAFHSRNSETEFPPKQHQIFKKKHFKLHFKKKKIQITKQ